MVILSLREKIGQVHEDLICYSITFWNKAHRDGIMITYHIKKINSKYILKKDHSKI
jgi:hypothetical protein